MSKIHLVPCPFDCGSEDGEPYIVHEYRCYWVICDNCEIAGLSGNNEEEAAENWNNRRNLTETEEYKRGYYDCKKQFLDLIKDKLDGKETKEGE